MFSGFRQSQESTSPRRGTVPGAQAREPKIPRSQRSGSPRFPSVTEFPESTCPRSQNVPGVRDSPGVNDSKGVNSSPGGDDSPAVPLFPRSQRVSESQNCNELMIAGSRRLTILEYSWASNTTTNSGTYRCL